MNFKENLLWNNTIPMTRVNCITDKQIDPTKKKKKVKRGR
ncbi:hypothetical protein lbkm_1512 [Lachnospiraceae bacterium KM106-2]|nr:hypothetical protein lbkm_1512 [Lachnospiraceae bacterium KM106-2]